MKIKGRNLSYWQEDMPDDGESCALYVRNTINHQWLLVGIYEKGHMRDVINTTYSNWPKGTIYFHQLP